MKLPRRELRKARIEIIPMIDTIFFLLVFFMISTLTMARMRAIPMALPKSAATKGAAAGGPGSGHVIVTMTAADDYYVGRHKLGRDAGALQPALTAQMQSDGKSPIVLNLARNQTAQDLLRIMDAVNGAKKATGQDPPVLIATEPVDLDGKAVQPAGNTP